MRMNKWLYFLPFYVVGHTRRGNDGLNRHETEIKESIHDTLLLRPNVPTCVGRFFGWFVALVMFEALPARAQSSATQDELNRTVLPIPQPVPTLITEQDVRKAKMPPRFELTAPKGASECPVGLIDDMGFRTAGGLWRPPLRCRRPTVLPITGCVTTVSTPRRSAVPAGPPC